MARVWGRAVEEAGFFAGFFNSLGNDLSRPCGGLSYAVLGPPFTMWNSDKIWCSLNASCPPTSSLFAAIA